ncbi:MAG: FAD-binding oxidoreductase [Proteobacteria bacterium]|nr:FAD-binding oxidoreductase [Pseudomonadota bacterium]
MSALETRLQALLGRDAVITDRDALTELSSDIFGSNAIAALAIQPRSAERLSEAVAAATEAGFALVPRGGGLSYTGGAVPPHDRCIVVDLRALDRIVTAAEGDPGP